MLLFGSETWVLIVEIMQKLEGVHVGLLRQVTGKKAQRIGDKTWNKEGADSVLQETGIKHLRYYINKRKDTVSE